MFNFIGNNFTYMYKPHENAFIEFFLGTFNY